jgi:hypothetical protein
MVGVVYNEVQRGTHGYLNLKEDRTEKYPTLMEVGHFVTM